MNPLPFETLTVPSDGTMSDLPTNAIIVGTDEVYIVDPGDSAGDEIIAAALAARGTPRVAGIVLTHGHSDHVRAAPGLRRRYGCPLLLGPDDLPLVRAFFDPALIDGPLTGGMALPLGDGRLEVIDTPGHTPGHVALRDPASRTLLAGDLVAGHGTVGILAPEGQMGRYLDTLARLQQLDIARIIPGHGPPLTQPPDVFGQYIARRLVREGEIVAALAGGPRTIDDLLAAIYPAITPQFRHAAAATLLAHLEKLRGDGRAAPDADDPYAAHWRATGGR